MANGPNFAAAIAKTDGKYRVDIAKDPKGFAEKFDAFLDRLEEQKLRLEEGEPSDDFEVGGEEKKVVETEDGSEQEPRNDDDDDETEEK